MKPAPQQSPEERIPYLMFAWCMQCGFEVCAFDDEELECAWCHSNAEFMEFGRRPATRAALADHWRRMADTIYKEVERKCEEIRQEYRDTQTSQQAIAELMEHAARAREHIYERAQQMERKSP